MIYKYAFPAQVYQAIAVIFKRCAGCLPPAESVESAEPADVAPDGDAGDVPADAAEDENGEKFDGEDPEEEAAEPDPVIAADGSDENNVDQKLSSDSLVLAQR